MAKYVENREENLEIKYLYKVWSGVDSRIELPSGLTGGALLPLLDSVCAPVAEKQPYRKVRFSPHFTWRSGATYAAALLLIIALSAFFGRNPGPDPDNIVGGVIPLHETSEDGSQAPDATPGDEGAVVAANGGRALPAEQSAQPVDASPTPDTAHPAGGGAQQPAAQDAPAAATVDTGTGVGGQSRSEVLGEVDEFTYTYRYNDETDPDKAGIPITVNVLHTSSGARTMEIDLPDLHTIDRFYVYEKVLLLVGEGENGIVLAGYDISHLDRQERILEHVQPGALIAANEYRGIVHLMTFAEDGADPGCEIETLPNSAGYDLCILTALDLATMEQRQIAFEGADAEAMLYNLNAYLPYKGVDGEEALVAHVRLDGVEIELRTEE